MILLAIAPVEPLCFADRSAWIEYLVEADLARGDGERGPVDMRSGTATFNRRFDFCKDCLAKHALSMHAQGRCQPDVYRAPVVEQEAAKC